MLHTKHTPSSQGHSFMSAVSFSRTIHPAMMKKLQYKQPKAMTPPFNHSLLCIHGVSLLLWLIEAYFNYLYSGKCWLLVLLPINHLANKDFYLFNYSTLGFTVRTASDVSEVFRISLLLWCLVLQRDSHRTSNPSILSFPLLICPKFCLSFFCLVWQLTSIIERSIPSQTGVNAQCNLPDTSIRFKWCTRLRPNRLAGTVYKSV